MVGLFLFTDIIYINLPTNPDKSKHKITDKYIFWIMAL